MGKFMTQEEFIEKAKRIHGDRYDYSKTNYINTRTEVCIICSKHGEFWQKPVEHISRKRGCPKCSGVCRSNTEEFVRKAKDVHGDKYSYSKVKYINAHTKVCIICPKHGAFWQEPNIHLRGFGCAKCGKCYRYNTEEWVNEMYKIYGEKHDYSKVRYVNAHTKVCIICPKHGEFWQTPVNYGNGVGCPVCKKIRLAVFKNHIS
jgi:flavorubredoxin